MAQIYNFGAGEHKAQTIVIQRLHLSNSLQIWLKSVFVEGKKKKSTNYHAVPAFVWTLNTFWIQNKNRVRVLYCACIWTLNMIWTKFAFVCNCSKQRGGERKGQCYATLHSL